MGIQLTSYASGDIGRVVALHADYYAAQWNFGRAFEAKVAEELGAFLADFDDERDGFWAARLDGAMAGSISIHGRDPGGRDPGGRDLGDSGARLRFFITDPTYQGRGVGMMLMDAAMAFCDEAGFKRVWLSTFEGLDPARRLYERHGFRLIETHPGGQWGREVQEQTFERLR